VAQISNRDAARIANGGATTETRAASGLSAGLESLLACAAGLLIANLYYAQPLAGLISEALGMSPSSAGLLFSLPVAGYGVGILIIVPLADLMENRRIVLVAVALEVVCVGVIGRIHEPVLFLALAFLSGLMAASVQVIVPYVSYLAPPAQRGGAIGDVVAGLMLGIMLAWPASSFAAHLWGWRSIFCIAAVLQAGLLVLLWFALPARQPAAGPSYGELLISMGSIFVSTPLLRRRAFYHAFMFGAFSVFWTAVPLWLRGPQFHLSQAGIGWVALAGVAGAIAPPIAGRLADRGFSQSGTVVAMASAIVAFVLSDFARDSSWLSVGLIVVGAVVLDFVVSANLVFGQRAIYGLAPEKRSRVNALFFATFFAGGAISSALSGWCYARFGWTGVSVLGIALPVAGLLYLATDLRKHTAEVPP
jgi:predicted MFS family arabinose efflux permease